MGAETGEAEGAAVAVADREHDPRGEVRVDAAAPRHPGKPGLDDLPLRIAELLQVLQQVPLANRRVADPERADDLLVDPLAREGVTGLAAGLVLPEPGLEERARVSEQL